MIEFVWSVSVECETSKCFKCIICVNCDIYYSGIHCLSDLFFDTIDSFKKNFGYTTLQLALTIIRILEFGQKSYDRLPSLLKVVVQVWCFHISIYYSE